MANHTDNSLRRTRRPILSVIHAKTIARLQAKLKPEGNCLVFTGSRSPKGYGVVDTMTKGIRTPILAHRLAWAWANQREPDPDKLICHRCNNPPCCNPDHLYEGTQADNMADMAAAGHKAIVRPWLGTFGAAHPCGHSLDVREEAFRRLNAQLLRGEKLNRSRVAKDMGISVSALSVWWKIAVRQLEQIGLDLKAIGF